MVSSKDLKANITAQAVPYKPIKGYKDFIKRVAEVHNDLQRRTAVHEARVRGMNSNNVAFFSTVPGHILNSDEFTESEKNAIVNLMAILTNGVPVTGSQGAELLDRVRRYRDKHGAVADWTDSLYHRYVEPIAGVLI